MSGDLLIGLLAGMLIAFQLAMWLPFDFIKGYRQFYYDVADSIKHLLHKAK